MSILFKKDQSNQMCCLQTDVRENEIKFWPGSVVLEAWYKNYPQHGTVQVLIVDKYRPNYVCNTFSSFYNVYIIGN